MVAVAFALSHHLLFSLFFIKKMLDDVMCAFVLLHFTMALAQKFSPLFARSQSQVTVIFRFSHRLFYFIFGH